MFKTLFSLFFSFIALQAFTHDIQFRTSTILIKTHAAEYRFLAEVAETHSQLVHGLMGRDNLEDGMAMLFIQPRNEKMSIWMKEVHMSVDLLFLNIKGQVTSLHPDMIPDSTAPVTSQKRVKGALELPAGSIKSLNIALGDRIIHEKFL